MKNPVATPATKSEAGEVVMAKKSNGHVANITDRLAVIPEGYRGMFGRLNPTEADAEFAIACAKHAEKWHKDHMAKQNVQKSSRRA
jgi:hypothetical protein